jgi:hypothetical protein
MIKVESSNIMEIGYDEEHGDMYVKFKSNKMYMYSDVPVKVFNELLEAESKGKYLNKNVKGMYDVDLIE